MTERRRDARLDRRPPALGCVLEERLLLREAEGDDRAVDRDRPAGDDQRLGRRMGAQLGDDGRPGREQLLELRVRGGWGVFGGSAGVCGSGCASEARRPAWGSRRRWRARRVPRAERMASVRPGPRARTSSERSCRLRRLRGRGFGVGAGAAAAASTVAGVSLPRVDRVGAAGGAGVAVAGASTGGVTGGVAGSGFAAGRCAAGDGAAEPVGIEATSLDDGAPGANIASSSWKRRPPMPARFGSIAASRRPAAARAAGSWRTAAGSARPAISSARIVSTAWSSSARTSRPRSSSVSRRATPGRAVAADQVIDERVHDLGVGQTEQVADGRLVDPFGCGRQELVEHRLRVAHAAGGQPGDQVDRGRHRRPGRPPRGSG